MSFTHRTVLRTEVTFHDDLVACAHKSRTWTSRSHAQQWQRGISHLRGVKTTGVTQCKQNGHVPHAIVTKLCVDLFSFHPPQPVSPTLCDMPRWCVHCQWSLVLTAMFCLLATGNAWNITDSEYCIPTSFSNTVTSVMCCCFLLPTSVGESHYLGHLQCQWSLLLTAAFCLLTTGNTWNMEHNR